MSCWEQPPYSHPHSTKVMSNKQLTDWKLLTFSLFGPTATLLLQKNTFSVILHIYSANLAEIVSLYYSCVSLTCIKSDPEACVWQYHIMVFAVCPLILSRVALFWIFHKVHWARFRLNEWTQNWSFSAPCLQGGPSAPSRQLTAQTDLHTHTCLCESCSRLQSGRTLNRASRHFRPSPLLSGAERESAELYAQHALRKPGKTSAPRGSPALWVSAGRKHDEHAAALKCGLF